MNIHAKILNKILVNLIQQCTEKIMYHVQIDFIQDARMIWHINRIKDKTIISIDAEKVFNKTKHPFMIKPLKKLRIEGMYLNIIKAIYQKHIANIKLNRKRVKPFSLKSGMRQGYPLSPLFFNIVLEFLARPIR
jgi:hypothetical protein